MVGDGWRCKDPHAEECEPGKELHPTQLLHGLGHVAKVFEDVEY